MEADNDRINAKTENAVVISIDEARRRRDAPGAFLLNLRDPVKESSAGFWILCILVIATAWYFLGRR